MDHFDLHLPDPDDVPVAPSSRLRKKKKQSITPSRDPQHMPPKTSSLGAPLDLSASLEHTTWPHSGSIGEGQSSDFVVDLTWVSESNRLSMSHTAPLASPKRKSFRRPLIDLSDTPTPPPAVSRSSHTSNLTASSGAPRRSFSPVRTTLQEAELASSSGPVHGQTTSSTWTRESDNLRSLRERLAAMRTRVVDTQCGSDIITFPDSLCAGLDVHEMASTQDLGHEFTKSPLSKTMRGESEALLVEEMVDAVYDSNYQPTYDDFPDYDCDYDVLSAPGVVIFDGSPGVYTSSKTAESEHAVINPVIYSSHCSEEMGANIDLLEKKCDGRDEGSDRSDLDYYEEGDGGNYCDYDTVPFEPDVSDAEEDSEAGSVAQSKLSDYRSISCEVLSTLSSFDPPLNSPAVPPIQGLRNEASVEDSSNGMSLLQRLRIRTGVSIDTKSSQGARVGSADAFTHRVMQPAAIGNAAVSATASKRRNADRPAMIPSLDDRNRKDTPIPGIGAGSVMPASEGAQSERRTVDMPDGWERDWEVVLLVDIREKENVVIQTHLLGRGIPCETTQLVLGDFLWAARRIGVPNPSSSLLYTEEATCDEDGTTVDTELDASVATSSAAKKSAKKKAKKPPKKSDEGPIDLVVLDCIVERKTTKDLAASIRDGRYKEQKRRLLRCGCRVPLYVVEGLTLSAGRPGFGGGGSRGVNAAALESSIISTQVSGIPVFRARGLDHTISFLSSIHECIVDRFKSGGNFPSVCPFKTFQRLNGKFVPRTMLELFATQLRQIPKCSEECAISLALTFGSMGGLIDFIDRCGSPKAAEKYIAGLSRGPGSKRKVGISLASVIVALFTEDF